MNVEEYLSQVYRIISENFRSNDPTGSMAVASAAYLVKRTLGHDQTAFGFAQFKDVLQELEKRGLLRTGPNSKNAFAVWVTGKGTGVAPQAVQTAERFRPLRNPVWYAFISEAPAGRRFLNKKTGEVRVGVTDRPTDGEDWVEITPIDRRQEQENALKFLSEKEVHDPTISASVNSERWYREFPNKLAEQHPALALEWKRERSRRVIEAAQAWCKQNSIDESLLFEDVPPGRPQGAGRSPAPAGMPLRELLLAAIQRMSTDELLRLHFRAQQLVAVLRPELLD